MAEIENRLLPSKVVRARFGISDMSLWRWLENETLGFPKPIYIQRRRFWRAEDIEAFIKRQAAKAGETA